MPTLPQTITNGYISSYLARLYNDKQSIFNGGALAAPKSPITIKMVADALNWGYNGGAATAASLLLVKNYLIWLCGKFGLEAASVTGTGGSVIPIVPTVTTPQRLDFVVSGSSLIATGGSSATFTNFIGYQLDFQRNGIPQSTLSSQPSYFSWDSNTGAFTCTPALEADELVALIPS